MLNFYSGNSGIVNLIIMTEIIGKIVIKYEYLYIIPLFKKFIKYLHHKTIVMMDNISFSSIHKFPRLPEFPKFKKPIRK